MRTINEIWKELQQHPDFVTGRIHTKQTVCNDLEFICEEDEDFSRIVELFVDENKTKIADAIDSFECDGYQYCSWTDNAEELIEAGKQKIFSYDSEIA